MEAARSAHTVRVDPRLRDYLMQIVEDPVRYGVPQIHFLYWQLADEQAKRAFVASFHTDPEKRRWYEERYLAPDYTIEDLAKMPKGSLGRTYHDHIVSNGLSIDLLRGYKAFQDGLEKSGLLTDMPDEMKYATLRGFQLHDILHPLTGYDTSPTGEIALQAFGLAQIRQVYAAVWMTVTAARFTFVDPSSVEPMMDAMSAGWQHGRRARNVMYTRWEELFSLPLDELRREFRLT